MTTYGIKEGARLKGDPQKIGEILEQIREKHGKLTPKMVLAEARRSRHPLHDLFLWDDGEAAERYREIQARSIIVAVVVRLEEVPEAESPRAFHCVRITKADDEAVSSYEPYAAVLSDRDLARQVIVETRKAITALRLKLKQVEAEAGRLDVALGDAEEIAGELLEER